MKKDAGGSVNRLYPKAKIRNPLTCAPEICKTVIVKSITGEAAVMRPFLLQSDNKMCAIVAGIREDRGLVIEPDTAMALFYWEDIMLKHTITVEKVDCGPGCRERFIEMDAPELPEPGKDYLVYMRSDVGPNLHEREPDMIRWNDDPEMLERGFPGNSNPSIRRFHGWRGTTDDTHIEALGVRKCLDVKRKEFEKSVRYHLLFGADQVKDQE